MCAQARARVLKIVLTRVLNLTICSTVWGGRRTCWGGAVTVTTVVFVSVEAGTVAVCAGSVTVVVLCPEGTVTTVVCPGVVTVWAGRVTVSVTGWVIVWAGAVTVVAGSVTVIVVVSVVVEVLVTGGGGVGEQIPAGATVIPVLFVHVFAVVAVRSPCDSSRQS
jgi:hypothetical protein